MSSILVLVGTTSFDELIARIDSPEFHKEAYRLGYVRLKIQIGRGHPLPRALGVIDRGSDVVSYEAIKSSSSNDSQLDVSVYRFKSEISSDIETSDLIISHGGAGTILEALRLNKKLLVVINEKLMSNHQWELANELKAKGCLLTTVPNQLIDDLKLLTDKIMNPLPTPDTSQFFSMIQEMIGVDLMRK